MSSTGLFAADYRRVSRDKLNGHWGTAVLTSFVAALLGATASAPSLSLNLKTDDFYGTYPDGTESVELRELIGFITDQIATNQNLFKLLTVIGIVMSIWSLATFILKGATKIGYCGFNRNLFEGKAKFSNLFDYYDIFARGFVANLLVTIFIVLWTCLFLIPGIVAGFAYSMTFYILADHPEMDAMDAIRESKRIMKGHKWELFCLDFSFIGWIFLSTFTLGIGLLFVEPYREQSHYAFYRQISGNSLIRIEEPQAEQPISE